MRDVLVRTVFGSHLYGLATEKSDRDFKGIFMPSNREICLGKIPESHIVSSGPEHTKNSSQNVDEEQYSLHYFVKLACQGQSVALDMLHSDQELVTSPEWEFMKLNRHLFYTKSMKAFVGYAQKQAAKYGIKGSRLDVVREALALLITKGDTPLGAFKDELFVGEHSRFVEGSETLWEVCGKKMGLMTKASTYVPMLQKYYQSYGERAILASSNQGVDWKAVSHAFRVGYQTRCIFKGQDFHYPLNETAWLLAVKNGKLDYTKTVAPKLEALVEELKELSAASPLPEKPAVKFWEDWLQQVTWRRMVQHGFY